jgi:hypothetical protein
MIIPDEVTHMPYTAFRHRLDDVPLDQLVDSLEQTQEVEVSRICPPGA